MESRGDPHVKAAERDLIDVRPDERLDLTKLEPYLRRHLPTVEGRLHVRQFGGGHANLTYQIRFGETEYVLRRPPLGPIAPRSHDMRREHRVLARLPSAFPLAPRSYHYCGDPSIIGAEFHVMERRRGLVLRTELPAVATGGSEFATVSRRIGEVVIDTMADLHRVDPTSVGLGDLGRPEGYVERQLAGWSKRWEAARDRELPPVADIMSWLARDVPRATAVSLVHNDYKPDNIMVDEADSTTPVAVLDWDMCTIGEPLMDFGYLLNFWPSAVEDSRWWIDAGKRPSWYAHFPTLSEAVDRYAERTGFPVDAVQWHHVFGVFKLLVVVQQIYIRYLRGQTQDTRFAGFGDRVDALADKALALIAE